MLESIGLIEFSSIAAGMRAVDAMVKEADIRLVAARTSCSGKYIGLVTGAVAEVLSAVEKGRAEAPESWVDHFVIPNVHEQVVMAAAGATTPPSEGALGVVETFSLASAIEAGDAAVKSAPVTLLEIRLGTGIGGKGFVTMVGDTAAVTTAVGAGADVARAKGLLVGTAVLPKPDPMLMERVL
jgi:microcompartment protein CcmL/EutN